MTPCMKLSENTGKITNPGSKEVWRFYDKSSGKAIADLITLADEQIDENVPYEIFDPMHTWKRKSLSNFTVRRLLEPLFINGKQVCRRVPLEESRETCAPRNRSAVGISQEI